MDFELWYSKRMERRQYKKENIYTLKQEERLLRKGQHSPDLSMRVGQPHKARMNTTKPDDKGLGRYQGDAQNGVN